MTGRNKPSPDSVLNLLTEAEVEEHPELVRAVEDIASLGGGSAPDACAELAQLMADGGRGTRSRRTKRRITFIGGALAVSMGVGMSGVAAETVHLQNGFDGAVDSITGFTLRDGVSQADGGPVPAVGAPPARTTDGSSASTGNGPAPSAASDPRVEVPTGAAPVAEGPSEVAVPSAGGADTSEPPAGSSTPDAGGASAPVEDVPATAAHAPAGTDAGETGSDTTEATDSPAQDDAPSVQASGGFAVWLWEAQRPQRAAYRASSPSAEWLGEPGEDPGMITLLAGPVTVDAEWLALFLAEVGETPGDGSPSDLPPVDAEVPGGLSPEAEVSESATSGVEVPKDGTPGAEVSQSSTPGTSDPGSGTPALEGPGAEAPDEASSGAELPDDAVHGPDDSGGAPPAGGAPHGATSDAKESRNAAPHSGDPEDGSTPEADSRGGESSTEQPGGPDAGQGPPSHAQSDHADAAPGGSPDPQPSSEAPGRSEDAGPKHRDG